MGDITENEARLKIESFNGFDDDEKFDIIIMGGCGGNCDCGGACGQETCEQEECDCGDGCGCKR